ncbi:hypothetical protein [Pseudomonas gozinkensis]|uniref:hypothetical protein n=1 Tax=Pseudomonas gozinkensis TaxID=2774461 RepID=UPI0017884693|nr:hypothetical protein [Pseudomonas gozinkensis]
MGSGLSCFFGQTGPLRPFLWRRNTMDSVGEAAAISRMEQGAGACVEPVVIGFVVRMVRGAGEAIQSAKVEFGRLSNARLAGNKKPANRRASCVHRKIRTTSSSALLL